MASETASETASEAANVGHQLSGLRDCRQPNDHHGAGQQLASKL